MNMFIIIFTAITCVLSCEHTKTYKVRGNNNSNNYYFDPRTYGTNDDNSCNTITVDKQFIDVVANKYVCQGPWCANGIRPNGWNCRSYFENCYDADYIINSWNNIPELKGCATQIYGNCVMVFGVWKHQMRDVYLCEKEEIYGDIYTKAYNEVRRCCVNPPPTVAPTSSAPAAAATENGTVWVWIIEGLLIFIGAIMVGNILKAKYYQTTESGRQDMEASLNIFI